MSHEEAISALEEQAILAALDTRLDPSVASEGSVDPELLREYREVLAELPLALELEAPPEHLRTRLLAALDPQASQGESTQPAPEPMPAPLLPFQRPLAAATERSASSRSFGWPQALAAALALAVVGLGWFALQLNARLADQQVTLTQLRHELDEQHQASNQLRLAQEQKYVMTQTAARLYQLQAPRHPDPANSEPSAPGQTAPGAHGALYICGKTHKWYVGLSGLQPTSESSRYQIWFVTDRGEVPSTSFQVSNPSFIEVDGDQLPEGIEIPDVLGVLVTFLPDGAAELPGGDLPGDRIGTAGSTTHAVTGQAVLRSQRSFEL